MESGLGLESKVVVGGVLSRRGGSPDEEFRSREKGVKENNNKNKN